jgi:peptidoglycan/xylan/chitin deacetylase (PgdA/CDA1 family)
MMRTEYKKLKCNNLITIVLAMLIFSSLLAGLATIHAVSATRGAVSITFDDGFQTQYDYALPLLQARGIPATFYVITGSIGASGYLTVSELQSLQRSGNEIDSHTVNHYNLPSLSYADMIYQLQVSQQTLRSWGLTANNFAYPGAVRTAYTDSIVHNYYRSARWGYVGPFTVQLPTSLFLLPAQQGDYGNSNDLPTIKALVDDAYNLNGWVNIVFHNVVPWGGTSQNTISSADFTSFLNYAQAKGVATITVDQALNLTTPLTQTQTPTPTPIPPTTPTPTPNPTATPTPISTPIAIPTSTPEPPTTPTPTLTPSPSPTATSTLSPSPTPSPTPTLTPTPTDSPADTATPTSTATTGTTASSTPAISAAPAPSATTILATTDTGETVDLTISENVTSSQMSNVEIASNLSKSTTTLSFTITGQSGTTGFGNVTIPKSAVTHGTTPTIYIDGQPAQNQGYTQDTNNYCVWYTTHFSTHEVSIVFISTPNSTQSPSQSQSLPQEVIYGAIVAVAIVAVLAVVFVSRKQGKAKVRI